MTLKFRSLGLVAFAISTIIFFSTSSASAAHRAAKKAPSKAAASKTRRGREDASSRRDSRKSRRASATDERRGRDDRHSSRRDRREERAERVSRKDWRHMSKRERMIAARAEAERRRREAEERARQIALAIARQRAADQALRDETTANIAKDETQGEDPEVRRVAMNALAGHAGTVVVMNPKTGQVYTVVNQEWGLRRGFKPCSTTKLVTGLAGLTEHVIDPVQTVNIGTASYRLDLTDALAFSDNGYFQRVGGQVGFDKMMTYARKLGLGQQTGINFPAESPGKLPLFKEGYAVNHMSSHGDDIEVTAIQLANVAAAYANGGHLLVPHEPRTPEENLHFQRVFKRDIDIPQENVQRMIPGMIGSVNYGSGKRAYNQFETIAGKTGTCTGQGSKLGLFTSFAPVHDPNLVVTVITRGSTSAGYRDASTIAGQVYRGLQGRFGPRPGTQPLLANDPLVPHPHIDPRKAAEINGEERDEDDATTAGNDAAVVTESGVPASQNGNAAQPAAQQRVLQKTVKTVERPAPQPSKTAAPQQPMGSSVVRPRRVSEKP
ncbi:MAG TPA: penicillin-binding transpeptidase domain-containing protein [Pyrinomonadaceae bacterium]|nr:penicillin-binding transpeptidase domain-containing protein [Pyrinomonadaceae bacterium]